MKLKKLKKHNFASKCLYLLLLAIFVGLNFITPTFAATSTDVSSGVCFVESTGLSYHCGQGTTNPCTNIQVVNTDAAGNQTAQGTGCGTGADADKLFAFTVNKCFSLDTAASGTLSWIEADCSDDHFKNPAPEGAVLPNLGESEDAAVASCQKASTTCDLTARYINPIINSLSIAVGIIMVISLVIAGIQYTTAGGNPQSAAAAKKRIFNVVIAAVTYLFLYGFLEFIVPGGFLNS